MGERSRKQVVRVIKSDGAVPKGKIRSGGERVLPRERTTTADEGLVLKGLRRVLPFTDRTVSSEEVARSTPSGGVAMYRRMEKRSGAVVMQPLHTVYLHGAEAPRQSLGYGVARMDERRRAEELAEQHPESASGFEPTA